jgi:hypothetical protein
MCKGLSPHSGCLKIVYVYLIELFFDENPICTALHPTETNIERLVKLSNKVL